MHHLALINLSYSFTASGSLIIPDGKAVAKGAISRLEMEFAYSLGTASCVAVDTITRVVTGVDELGYQNTYVIFLFVEAGLGWVTLEHASPLQASTLGSSHGMHAAAARAVGKNVSGVYLGAILADVSAIWLEVKMIDRQVEELIDSRVN